MTGRFILTFFLGRAISTARMQFYDDPEPQLVGVENVCGSYGRCKCFWVTLRTASGSGNPSKRRREDLMVIVR